MTDEPTSEFIEHIPCEKCGSSDGNSTYTDGHEYCHVCQNFIPGDGGENPPPSEQRECQWT